jgi:hypothetical protein
MQSGSVWVAVMAHARHNVFLLTFFSTSFRGSPVWVSEGGILPVLAYGLVVLGMALWGRPRKITQQPANLFS